VGPVRVLIADDHRLFAESLMVLLTQDDRLDMVGIASDGREAIRLAQTLQPDIVLLDVHMPLLDGVAALSELRLLVPDARVILLTGTDSSAERQAAREAGADAFLLKSVQPETLLDVILITTAFAQPAALS
jgi:two-component system nitrate/nitrite response regulator NarL